MRRRARRGAAAQAKELLADVPGFSILESDPNYYNSLSRAEFCLAPTGDGWGRRATLAAMYGCIPVIVQDDISQPFEEQLPWDKFSIRGKSVITNASAGIPLPRWRTEALASQHSSAKPYNP